MRTRFDRELSAGPGAAWLADWAPSLRRAAARMARLGVALRRAVAGSHHLELTGRLCSPAPTPSPVDGSPCAYWESWLERRTVDERGRKAWHPFEFASSGPPALFAIEQANGRVAVWPRGADFLLAEEVWVSDGPPPPEPALAMLARRGLAWRPEPRLRVRHRALRQGAAVHVTGALARPDEVTPLAARTRILDQGSQPGWLPTLLAYRSYRTPAVEPPSLPPETRLLWRGRGWRAFTIADRPLQRRWRGYSLLPLSSPPSPESVPRS